MTRNGAWNDTVVGLRNRNLSSKAWHKRKQHFCREKYTKDFCNGFRAGFEAVATGSDGCTPAFPPSEYWGWQYQSADGQARSAAWFAGYPHGARAAEEDGVAFWNQVPMSAGMQAEYQNAGVLTHEGALYPIPDSSNSLGGNPLTIPMMDGSSMPLDSFNQMNAEEIAPQVNPLGSPLPFGGPVPLQP
ncbi:hypothetical protein [Aureliella helgolandensis]|nr:hypothetical protein [Aureliella helgolandensis]